MYTYIEYCVTIKKALVFFIHCFKVAVMRPNTINVLDLLSNKNVTFYIPPYQRNYEWEKEQCEILFNDVIATYKKNVHSSTVTTEHFFGTITFFESEGAFGQPTKLILIDGQQRLTSTMLFLVAIRDIVKDEASKTFINDNYLKNDKVNSDNDEYKIKLKQVETDWEAFCDLILQRETLLQNSRVFNNYYYFKSKIESYVRNNGITATDLIQHGLNNFRLVTVQLEPQTNTWENPQEIFESMNSIGKPLSLADLIRNYLLMDKTANEQEYLYNKYWLTLEKTLPEKLSDFFRDYMQLLAETSYPVASDKNHKTLYQEFKKLIGNHKLSCNDILERFVEYSQHYAIIIGKDSLNSEHPEISRMFRFLNTIGCSIAYSFFMALVHSWKTGNISEEDLKNILRALVTYFLRRRIISLTQAENKVFPTLVKHIPELEESDDKVEMTYKILSKLEFRLRIPNDKEVKNTLEQMNFYNFKLAKFIFCLIEESITKAKLYGDDNIEIEHIMPQTLPPSWKSALGSNWQNIYDEYINNIGNLTLIRHNQELRNKPFEEKKKIYNDIAGIQLAKTKIIDCEEWNEKSIESRKDWIIDHLLSNVLSLPFHYSIANNYLNKDKNKLSFEDLDIIGEEIQYIDNPRITARVVSDTEVEFEGEIYKLSPLTKKLKEKYGKANKSGAYRGSEHWAYQGEKLTNYL